MRPFIERDPHRVDLRAEKAEAPVLGGLYLFLLKVFRAFRVFTPNTLATPFEMLEVACTDPYGAGALSTVAAFHARLAPLLPCKAGLRGQVESWRIAAASENSSLFGLPKNGAQ